MVKAARPLCIPQALVLSRLIDASNRGNGYTDNCCRSRFNRTVTLPDRAPSDQLQRRHSASASHPLSASDWPQRHFRLAERCAWWAGLGPFARHEHLLTNWLQPLKNCFQLFQVVRRERAFDPRKLAQLTRFLQGRRAHLRHGFLRLVRLRLWYQSPISRPGTFPGFPPRLSSGYPRIEVRSGLRPSAVRF
jgi:hypothetical protein